MMEGLLGTKSAAPGIRFYPTDEELFMYYLKNKVMGKSLKYKVMSDVDVYRFLPWELPAMSCLKTRDLNWFFFCPRLKKYPNGGRANRATDGGYWKSTGNDRIVNYKSRPVGKIKTLVFHIGKAPKGDRTDWVMHEYRLEDKDLVEKGVPVDSYVICKIYEKSGLGPKNGENYGARFVEEDWESDDDNAHGSGSVVDTPNVASPVDTSMIAATYVPAAFPGSSSAAVFSVDNPYVTAATALGTPNVTLAALGTPDVTLAALGTPDVTTASVDSVSAVTEPVFTYSTAAAVDDHVETPSSAATLGNTVGTPLNAATAVSADEAAEFDELLSSLSCFTENHAEDVGDFFSGSLSCFTVNQAEEVGDIFSGLEDLAGPFQLDKDMSWKDSVLELDDLLVDLI